MPGEDDDFDVRTSANLDDDALEDENDDFDDTEEAVRLIQGNDHNDEETNEQGHPIKNRGRRCCPPQCGCWLKSTLFIGTVVVSLLMLATHWRNNNHLPPSERPFPNSEDDDYDLTTSHHHEAHYDDDDDIQPPSAPSPVHHSTNKTTSGKHHESNTKDAHQKDDDFEDNSNSSNNSSNSSLLLPQIAWIMSFGGSGTSYTIVNTEAMSGMTTASNYGRDYNPCVAVHPEIDKNGPFVRSLHKPRPPQYILTKTHCGGFCMDCAVDDTFVDGGDVTKFEHECRTGKRRRSNGQVVVSTYADTPASAIHLIRNPFDNIVGRMHLAAKHGNAGAVNLPNNATGVSQWCQYLAENHKAAVKEYAHVPCVNEWYRYIQWHNLAYRVTSQHMQRTHILYYDNYTTNFDATVTGLFDFLQLPINSTLPPYPWRAGKTYTETHFERSVAQQAAQMMHALALPPVWELIKHYLEPYLLDDTDDSDDQQDDFEEEGTVGDDDDDDGSGDDPDDPNDNGDDDKEPAVVVEEQSNVGVDDPQVVWLMSFPNSGTSYTISNVEHTTKTTTATNYAKGWKVRVPVRPELVKGPFLHKTQLAVPQYVLTKTHCASYCDDCGPHSYVVSESKKFERGCRRSDMDDSVNKYYDKSVPVKAVHLFRSPFDNIVARMHLAVKRHKKLKKLGSWSEDRLAKFGNNPEGFANWCTYLDGKYAKEEAETQLIPDNVKALFADVPCHADWYRYVQWHNQAVAVTKNLDLPVHYLHYEDYSTRYNATLSGLLDYLELEQVHAPDYFIPGKTYINYYQREHAVAAAKLAQAVATPECWELIQHYFTEWLD